MIEFALTLALMAQEPRYNARCLIEIAEMTGEGEVVKTEEGRAFARAKAEQLDAMIDELAYIADEMWPLIAEVEAEKRDLFENGLITEEEWGAFQAEYRETRAGLVEGILDTKAPSCRFDANVRHLPIFAIARNWRAANPQ